MDAKKILLIEDNEGDIELTKLSLEDCKTKSDLFVIKDGLEALNYLLKESKANKFEKPDLILLDIKLPNKNGFEILKEIRQRPSLQDLQVMMLTTGDSIQSFEENYQVKANGYLMKPIPLKELDECLSRLN